MEEKEKAGNLVKNIIKPKTDTLDYGFKVLSNGLKVLLISDPETTISSAALAVNIGSLVNKKDEQGLAHFCEHLLFMGNKKYPSENEYSDYLSKNGGYSNASTTLDNTLYYFDVSNEAFEGALDRFAQFFISSNFNESSVEREIKAIDNEFSNYLNDDDRRLSQIKLNELNKDSPFNNFMIGNLKTLTKTDIREKLLVFYKKYYTSEIMNLCVYSNKSLEELFKLIESLFSLIPKLENFEMPRYDEVKPYDETNLKYFYKIIPVKNMNQIELEWYLPYCDNYHARPLGYLSSAIGHEGPYTLTSSLNRDNLIDGLLAAWTEHCKTFMTFYIRVALTKKGLENYKEVILRILKYVKVIQSKEINKRYYEELKELRQMKFDYREKRYPSEATEEYAENLIDYDIEDVISGPYLYGEFNEPLIRKYLDMLTLDNLNIYFRSKSFEKECNLVEEYYGTKYCKEKINITEDEINSYKCDHIFDYPPENKFIPKNFELLPPPEKINKYPEKIKSHKNMEVWHLQDTKFKVPKACAFAQFISPEDLCDFSEIKIRIISVILNKIITSELGEFLFMAKSANVNVNFSFGTNKTHIIFQGFNDSLKEGMKNILERIKNLDINTERCKEILEMQQKDILRRAENIFLNTSYIVNKEYVVGLIQEPYKNPKDFINFFKEKRITLEDLILYKNAIFQNSKIKWLFQGNVSKEEVLKIAEEANKILEIDIEKEKIGKFYNKRPVVITKNNNYIFRIKSPNPKEENSSLISLYQTDLLNNKEIQYLKLIESFLSEKFYDQLRTKETLGYIVDLSSINKDGYLGLLNIIQSNSKTPEFCASRVRNFYKESYQKVKEITEEEFQKHVNARIANLNEKDEGLNGQFLRNWCVISDNTYEFDYLEKSLENVKQCNREEFIKFYEKYFINEVAILDSELLCEAHYEQNEKELKEAKILEGENIKKRIICETIDDFKACNCLGVIYYNPVFKLYND